MIGRYRHVVQFQNPGAPVPDGDGGFTQSWTDLDPAFWDVAIVSATARDLERRAPGTVISTATHVVTGRFHPGVTTQTRMLFEDRTFNITGKANLDEREITMELIAVEVLP